MPTNVRVHVDAHEVPELLSRVGERAENFHSVFDAARGFLEAANAANFASGGLPAGGWPPLQPQTAAWKVSEGLPPIPLVGGGALEMSLTSLRGPANYVGFQHAEFGTDVEYAKFHQYGAPRAHLPVRRVVFEPPGMVDLLAEAGAMHLSPSTPLNDLKALFS